MTEKKTNLLDKSVLKTGRNKKGQFIAGTKGADSPNATGRNGFMTIRALTDVLENKKFYNKDNKKILKFWEYVVHRASKNDTVLMAILKKLLPDKLQGEGFSSGAKIVLVYPEGHKKPKEIDADKTKTVSSRLP